MQQRQERSKILKIKDFIEFKNWMEDHAGQDFYILYFSSLGERGKDLSVLNELRRLLMVSNHANPSSDILIVDSWDVPEAFTFFPGEPITTTPTLVMVQRSGNLRISDHLSFIEEKIARIMVLPIFKPGIRLV